MRVVNMEETKYFPHGNEIHLFKHAAINKLPVVIKGPTGCGKTRFVQYMAKQLDRPLFSVSCHDDLSAADLVGRHLIDNNGTYWHDGPLTRAVRDGGICYLDEVVEARRDTTVVLHPLSDHRRELSIERTGEVIEAHPNFMLVLSYNPGYQNIIKGLKPSTRQRFLSLTFDYPDRDKEIMIVSEESGASKDVATRLVDLANDIRRLKGYDLEETVSTRLLVYCGIMIHSGFHIREACQSCVVEPLTDDNETISVIMRLVDNYF